MSLRGRIALGAVGCLLALPASSAVAETIPVESTLDEELEPSANGCNSTPSGVCTLRAALEWATADADTTDLITVPAGN